MAKKKVKKVIRVHRAKKSDFFGYSVADHPVFTVAVGLLVASSLLFLLFYFAR